ncbi:hypothetical protein BOTBODRAFT_103526 [Botryobasidium botryosum FD-172 SS1]|uniref:Smr domain-containing protein n=1 Tax=Botryobasidium botryosum (strain FD-172 SS1) TaxID=930990 RepID=A0A067N5T3_BOTB1|nr:hypothetical protein BOTBODRAFT_103526 [Botryobasidium botryosum FD-172 SS1]
MPDPTLPASKFLHIRAFLSSLAKEYGRTDIPGIPLENEGADTGDDGDLGKDKDITRRVVALLEEENEDELRDLLKESFGISDDSALDQCVLELMHKHKDDLSNAPLVFLTPTKRPISRPSSRASTHSYRGRPETPTSATNSLLSHSLRRPHTPVGSPLGPAAQLGSAGSHATARNTNSPSSSPTPAHATALINRGASTAGSQPSSPIASPRFLNAKAAEFRPISRPNPSTPGSLGRTDTPSPDLWSNSAQATARPTSRLAIAAPLVPNSGFFPQPRTQTPSSLQNQPELHPSFDDEDDEFSPFGKRPVSDKNGGATHLRRFPTGPMSDSEWSDSAPGTSPGGHPGLQRSYSSDIDQQGYSYAAFYPRGDGSDHANGEGALEHDMDGMTPLDVLYSIFGTTIPPATLEDALTQNGYDFEAAMTWLMDKTQSHTNNGQSAATHHPAVATPTPRPHQMTPTSGRVVVVPRDAYVPGKPGLNNGRQSPRYGNRSPAPVGGNRVCRYFLSGECRRADCRFSHDVERALCRFWLRNQCAKGDQCEFLHTLPKDGDLSTWTAALSQADAAGSQNGGRPQTPPVDEFPALSHAELAAGRGRGSPLPGQYRPKASSFDPGRTRFATAAKKSMQSPPAQSTVTGSRYAAFPFASYPGAHRNAAVTPRPSPRIKLRPPSLLPSLPTGQSINALYMSYRQSALKFGALRNASLTRAAEAWKRGDHAAAKEFSKEAHAYNAQMSAEAAEAASKLIQARVKVAMEAVRQRDSSWSDDPGDRTRRGKSCGAGLGVCLGVASNAACGHDGPKMTTEEKTECLLDLHGLHSNEAVEVLEDFVMALEKEHHFGLTYVIVGEEKHTGTQDAARGASRARLAAGVREWLSKWGYPWSEREGVICVDILTHAQY